MVSALVVTMAPSPATATVVGPVQTVSGTENFQGVACYSTTSCVAVGYAPTTQVGQVVMITDGIAGPAQATPGAGFLTAVSCSSGGFCLAVGPGQMVPITNGVAGAAQPLPGISPSGVACSTPTDCVVVGGNSVVAVTNGVPGAVQTVTGVDQLYGVACSGAGTCYAVGTFAPDPINDPFTAFGEIVPITNGVAGATVTVTDSSGLRAIDCASATTCVAVGTGGLFGFEPVVVTITNGTPEPAKTFPTFVDMQFLGIGCADVHTCEGVGFSGGASGVVPIVDGVPGTIQVIGAGTGLGLYDAACSNNTSCVAAGIVGNFPYQGAVVDITVGAGSTLSCAPGTTGPGGMPVMACTATAPAGIRSLRATNATSGTGSPATFTQSCSPATTTGAISFPASGSDRYRLVVTDCERPGAQDIYQVRADGTVRLIRSIG